MSTGTQVQVVMPQMGVSVSEGTVTKWLKQVGEQIEQDEPLLEISTDKVDTEVPSPGAGTVIQILVPEGETVEVGTVLALIGAAGSQAAAEPVAAEPPAEAAAPEPPAYEPATEQAPAPAPPVPEPAAVSAPPAAPAPVSAPSGNGKSFVSPVVARIAAEHGVDPSVVPGTGTGGRVTKKDILAFIESGAQAQQAQAQQAQAQQTPAPTPAPAPAPEAAPVAVPEPAPVVAPPPISAPVAVPPAPVAPPTRRRRLSPLLRRLPQRQLQARLRASSSSR